MGVLDTVRIRTLLPLNKDHIMGWFSKKEKPQTPVTLNDDTPYLHGVNLNEWNYLGYTQIAFSYNKINADLYFFENIKNSTKRKFVIKSFNDEKRFAKHAYITQCVSLWLIGEFEWYDIIRNHPSKYTKRRMLAEYNSVWSKEELWWVAASDAAKYDAAVTSNNTTNTTLPKIEVDNNVLKVDFVKKSD